MAFPPAFLEELRARLSLSGIVGRRIRLLRAGREFKGVCPFHAEKTPSFYINDDKQFFHCFGCGAHGDIIGFMMRYDHLSFIEAIESLAAQAGMIVPTDTPIERERYDREKRLYQLMDAATNWFAAQLRDPKGREGLGYLRGRGMSDDTLARFRLGYAPGDAQAIIRAMTVAGFSNTEMEAVGLIRKSTEGREGYFSFFRNRVIFPVGDRRGRTVAFGGRIIGEGEPKYLNSPDSELFRKGKLLYGLSRAREAGRQRQPVIVVEGYMDAIALAEAGYSGAVAPLGTALTDDQITLLWQLAPKANTRDPSFDYSPILCFDGDSAGLRAGSRAIERILPQLTPSCTARIAHLPEGEDPDSLLRKSGKAAMQAVLDNARPMFEAVWEMTLAGRRMDTPEARGEFIQAIRQRVRQIRDDSLRSLYGDELSRRLNEMTGKKPANQAVQSYQNRSNPFDKRKGGVKTWGVQAATSVIKRPLSAARSREQRLLTLLIQHPCLFNEFGEDLIRIDFTTPHLDALRRQLIDIFTDINHESLDFSELSRHLSARVIPREAASGLAEVLSPDSLRDIGGVTSNSTYEEAKRWWRVVWDSYLRESLQAELRSALQINAQEPSDSNRERVSSLQTQLTAFMSEQANYDFDDTDSLTKTQEDT